MLIEMIFEAGVVLVVWTACSQCCLCIPQPAVVLQNNADFDFGPYHLQQAASKALEKRETLWLHNFKQKWHFCFSMCMPCTAGKCRESCGDNSVGVCREPLALFTPAAHVRTSNTVPSNTLPHSFNVHGRFSFECGRADVPSVWEWTCGCWESCWSTRLRLRRLSLEFARSTI